MFRFLFTWFFTVSGLLADEDASRHFSLKVRPLLESKCLACHGNKPDKLKGKFEMRTRAGLLKGGESGNASLVPGKPDSSPIFVAVTRKNEDLQMPPKENDRLSSEQIGILRKWIADGAPWPDEASQKRHLQADRETKETQEGVIITTSGGQTDEWTYRRYQRKDLWAYQPVRKPAVPWKFAFGSKNPIDAFINHRLAAKSLKPAPEADRRTIIRRAAFDLTGLPPSPGQVDAFLDDKSGDAYSKLIKQFLASPLYGEQWGRHWLDVVRYADSAGFSNDFTRANAWRYRDYVIRSFNSDKPYDLFIKQQLAGDEMDAGIIENLIAVGFLRMGPWEQTSMSVAAVTRQQFLDDITNSVGVTFLAHPLRCARCHDHKFDPIPTRDYYGIQAVFASTQFADRDAPYQPYENTKAFGAASDRLAKRPSRVRSISTLKPKERPNVKADLDTEKKGHAKVNRKFGQYLSREKKRTMPFAFSVYSGPDNRFVSTKVIVKPGNMGDHCPPTHILKGGSLESPGDEVGPGVMSVLKSFLNGNSANANEAFPGGAKGRRLALAEWIASPDNPLTARVMVNRIWQYHFGKALAGNPNNFGKTGKKPSHPELLDFLAAHFVENGWKMKEMHRLIMTSDAYQRASQHPDIKRLDTADPNQELLAVFTPRRLAAEEMRDSMLAVSGELNSEMGGLPVHPEINLEVAMQPRHIMGSVGPAYQPSPAPELRNRRSIYAERIRTLRDPMMEVFNQPGFDTSCEARDASTVTPQVFALFNGENTYNRAVAMALKLEKESKDSASRIKHAFKFTFGRSPTPTEIDRCNRHLREMARHHNENKSIKTQPPKYVIREMIEEMTGLNFYWVEDLDRYKNYKADKKLWEVEPATRALADLCLVLFNSNEFVYVY